MRLRSLVLLCGALCALVPVHGQIISVYGLFTPQHVTHVETGDVYAASTGYVEQYTDFWAPAVGGGITFNFLNAHVVKLGIDVRGSTKPGTTGADTAQLGLRLGFKPPILKIKPYVQAGVGYLATRTTNLTTSGGSTNTAYGGTFGNQYATFGVQGGVDTPLAPFLDWRVFELGVSHALNVGITTSANNANMLSLGTGVVFRF